MRATSQDNQSGITKLLYFGAWIKDFSLQCQYSHHSICEMPFSEINNNDKKAFLNSEKSMSKTK